MVKPNPPERDIRGRDVLLAVLFGLANLALLGDIFPELPGWIITQVQENRWYRAAAWAAWLFCGLGGGLLVIGSIAQGNEETREFARTWGRTKGKVVAGSAPEDSYPA